MNKVLKRIFCSAAAVCLAALFVPGLAACDDGGSAETELFTYEATEGGYAVTGVTDPSAKELIVPDTHDGEDVVAISEGAFANCVSCVRAQIPSTVQTIGKNAFRGCRSLGYLSIPFTGQKASASAEKGLFGYIFGQADYVGATEVVQVFGPSEEENETFYIPAALKEVEFTGTAIPYGAFSNCTSVSAFTVGALTETIGERAFLGNALAYVYVESNAVSAVLVGPAACGGLLSNVPAVCIGKDVNRLSGYVEGMDTSSAWSHGGAEYTIYANKKFYRFEAEQSVLSGGLSTSSAEYGANGVLTGGGWYVTGFYPNGGAGNCGMQFHIDSSKDATVRFIYCCGARSTHYFNSCYRLTLNGTVVVPEQDVNLSLPAGEPYLWSQWTRFYICDLQLKAGENIFDMHFTPDGKETAEAFSNDMYVDYIEFETDAILTWAN